MVAIVGGLLLQPDIGQTALMLATWAALLFLSGISWLLIVGLAGWRSDCCSAPICCSRTSPSASIPSSIPRTAGTPTRSTRRSTRCSRAAGSGRGPGESIAKKFIPDAHADYVFSAAAGEFGILFCLCLVALIAFIVVRALVGAQRQSSLFARLGASTLAIQFGLQSGINLAVNLNLIPPKGMTLPFVSYGGTSMIAIAFGMGLMLALTRKKPEERMATGLPAYRSALTPPNEHVRADGRRHGRPSLPGDGAGAGIAPTRPSHPPDDRPPRRELRRSFRPAKSISCPRPRPRSATR